jgi:hypothetical protein
MAPRIGEREQMTIGVQRLAKESRFNFKGN